VGCLPSHNIYRDVRLTYFDFDIVKLALQVRELLVANATFLNAGSSHNLFVSVRVCVCE